MHRTHLNRLQIMAVGLPSLTSRLHVAGLLMCMLRGSHDTSH